MSFIEFTHNSSATLIFSDVLDTSTKPLQYCYFTDYFISYLMEFESVPEGDILPSNGFKHFPA